MQKPDVNIFLHALAQADADPKNSVFVGDGGSNEFLGACGASLTTIFTTQLSKPYHLEKVRVNQGASIDHTINHVREVLGFLTW